jgi:hypothetical protein
MGTHLQLQCLYRLRHPQPIAGKLAGMMMEDIIQNVIGGHHRGIGKNFHDKPVLV